MRRLFLLCLLVSVFSAYCGDVRWRGGDYAENSSWKGGVKPAAGDKVYFDVATGSGTNTVTLTTDESVPISQINFNSANGAYLAFDGEGRKFIMPEMDEGGTYEKEAVHFYCPNYGHVFSVSGYDIANVVNSSPWSAENAYFVFGIAEDGGTSLEFTRGNYNFYNPDGVAYPARTVVVGTSLKVPSTYTAFENCSAVFPKLWYAANAPTNIMRFADGTYTITGEFGSFQTQNHLGNCKYLGVDIDNAEVTVGGDTRLYANTGYGDSDIVLDRIFRFDVRNGSNLTTTNAFYSYRGTNSVVSVSDSTWTALGANYSGALALGIGFGGDDYMYVTTSRLVAVNSVFNVGREHAYGNFYFGKEVDLYKRTKGDAYLTNCTINCKAALAFNYSDAVFKDCQFSGNTIGQNYSFVVASDSNVTIDGGNYVNVGGPRLSATSYSRRGPVLRIVDGIFGNPNRENYAHIGQGSTVATEGVTNVVVLSGGTFNARWIELAQSEQAARFDLEGGTFMVKTVYGGAGRSSNGKSGWAHFVGNGGVYKVPGIETYSFTRPIFYNLDALEAGSKGLVVDTNGFDPMMKQGVSNLPGENGCFVKRGLGSLTVYPVTPWTVAQTIVESGKLIVSTNGIDDVDEPVSLASALTVMPEAVFSTEGDAKKVEIGSLALTNGVLRLDPGDCIIVKGDILLKGLKVQFTRAPALGEEIDFLACEQQLSADAVLALRTASLSHGLEDGTFADFSVVTGEDGKSSVKFVIKNVLPIQGETTWQGPGSEWLQSSNWSSGAPDGEATAVFGAAGAPLAVELDADTGVGALSFASGSFTLGGSGILSFASPGSSRIDVGAGSHLVNVPMVTVGELPVDVAEDASLALGGRIAGRGISKEGGGALELNAQVSGSVKISEGLVVANGGSLSEVSLIKLGDGTLRVAEGASCAKSSLQLVSSNATSAVVLDNAADLTVESFVPTSGALIKRGKGRLTIDASSGNCAQLAAGIGDHYSDGMLQSGHNVLFAFAEDGMPPQFGFGGFNVAGGEVVVRGNGNKVGCKGAVHVGLRTSTDCGAQPSLTIDNVHFDALTSAAYQHFIIGFHTADAGNFTTNPVVRLVNGATLSTIGVFMGYPYANDLTRTGARLVFAVTNSTVNSSGSVGFSQLRKNGGVAQLLALNATLEAPVYEFSGNTDSRVSACVLSSNNGGYAKFYGDCYGAGTVLFDVGTLLKINAVEFKNPNYATHGQMMTFAFDGATWDPGPAGLSLNAETLTGYLALRRFEMRGEGLTLHVAENSTFRSDALFFGSGDLLKTGKGVLAFGNGALGVEGTIRVNEGALDLADAGVVSNTKFAGCGTVLGAAFGGGVRIDPGIGEGWMSGELPVFDGCSFQRGVTVEIDSSIAQKLSLPSPHRVAVARFVGNAPDVSCWRVSRSWGRSDVRGKFSIEDDTVYMTVDYSGLKLIVR